MVGKILVPTDYSEPSLVACNHALDLAGHFGASVELLHVWSAPYFGPEYDQGAPSPDHQSLFELIRQRATEEMKAFVGRLDRPASVPMTTTVESGEIVQTVLKHIEATRPDWLVLGTHGRTGAKYLLLGSIATRLVQLAPCPVLTVPKTRGSA
jgi:universal stress protein A